MCIRDRITAGVGAFSTAASPKIFVNDKEIQLNSDGVAEYKTKVPNEIGTYKKQVKIEYIKPDGTRGSVEKEIIYTVDESVSYTHLDVYKRQEDGLFFGIYC